MKKIFISLALAVAAMTATAQSVVISTYNGTDMAQYAGQVKDIRTSRQMFNGWNTVSFPYSMTQEQVNEAFGSDCKLEKLTGVNQNGSTIYLNFADAKAQGIQANTPYILYYGGESKVVTISLKGVELQNAQSKAVFTTQQGVTVSMTGAQTITDGVGLYGIRVIDNKEANFVDVTSTAAKFFATRCYVEVAGASGVTLVATHNAAKASTSTAKAKKTGTYNIFGSPVSKDAKGFKIIDGKKTL